MKLRELLSQMQEVQENIGSSEPYICGGTPRDRYLKHLENISDIDITTGDKTVAYLAQEFATALRKKYNAEIKTMPDGHSTIFIGNLKLDFSSNFNAPNIDVLLKKMGIANPTEMQKEMFSRDFTCNSLLLSLNLKNVIDPTHLGFKDIDKKIIKTCLDPEITLTTNRNRVIRAIYLATKLDFDIDDGIVKYVQAHPETADISTEKVMSEKTNEAFKNDPDKASFYVTKMNLWNYIPITEIVYPYYMQSLKRNTNVAV
jgi:poly(A) polymerase